MKRTTTTLIFLLILTLLLPTLAQVEKALTPESIPADWPRTGEHSWRFAGQMLPLGQSVYALYPGEDAILRWTPGDEAPEIYYQWRKPEPLGEGGRYDQLTGAQKALWDQQIHDIFSWQDKLFGLNRHTRRVGEISPEGVTWQEVELDLSKWLKNLNEGGWPEERCNIFQQGDRLCVGYNVSDMSGMIQFDYALLSVDLKTGKAQSVDTGLGQGLVAYKPGQALALGLRPVENGYQYQLRSIDVATGKRADVSIEMPVYRSGDILAGLAYDQARDIIYYNDGSRVYLSQQGGPFAAGSIMQIGRGRSELPGLVMSDGRYGAQQEGLWLIAVKPGGAEGYLKMHLDFAMGNPIYRAYLKDHPDAKVLLSEGRMSAAEVVTDMQGQTEPVDIYQLPVQSDFSAFKDKGYAADIGDDPVISEAVERMYPFVQEALKDQEGRLVAVPAGIQISHGAVSPEHYDVFFKGQPYPETWQEYLAQLYQFEQQSPAKPEYNFQDWMTYEGLLGNIMDSYIQTYERPGEALTFDRPELKETLDLLMKARDLRLSQGQSMEMRIDDAEDGVLPPSIYFPSMSGVNATLYNDERTDEPQVNRLERLKPFTFVKGEKPIYRVLMEAFVLNPASQNRELALDFLRYGVQRETEPKFHIMMDPSDNEPIIQDDYEQKVQEAQDNLASLQAAYDAAQGEAEKNYQAWQLAHAKALTEEPDKNKWLVSPGSIAQYRGWADQIRSFSRSPYIEQQYNNDGPVFQQLRSLCARYMAGQLDQAGFIQTLNETYRLVYLEQK